MDHQLWGSLGGEAPHRGHRHDSEQEPDESPLSRRPQGQVPDSWPQGARHSPETLAQAQALSAARPSSPAAVPQFSPMLSTSLPTFSPANSLSSASGKASTSPSTSSSREINLPSAIQPAISLAASP